MMAQSGSGGGEIEVPNGVYIQDTDGVLWQEAAWDGSATPNGIAVVTDECRFVIAMKEKTDIRIDADRYSDKIDLTTYSSSSEAITDFSGPSNTTAMVLAYGNYSNEAAGYCANFTFPNGKGGYLGSAGEWQAAYDNKSAIETCMSKAGGTAIDISQHFSSTRGEDRYTDYNRFWALKWSDGSWQAVNVSSSKSARPFTELGEVTGIVEA